MQINVDMYVHKFVTNKLPFDNLCHYRIFYQFQIFVCNSSKYIYIITYMYMCKSKLRVAICMYIWYAGVVKYNEYTYSSKTIGGNNGKVTCWLHNYILLHFGLP